MSLDKREIDGLWEEIQTNQARLKACDSHQFAVPRTKTAYLKAARVTCTRCSGWMSRGRAVDYARGFIAAGGSATDVLVDGWPLNGDDWAKEET